MLIKACLNGGTTTHQHPSVPRTAAELAADAKAAVDAGAGAIHVHPRDAAGAETIRADAVLAAVRAIRDAVPGTPVGVTTGIWTVDGDQARRMTLVSQWGGPDLPDFASVNLCEPGANELAAKLTGLGIAIEAGLWTAGDADQLAASDFAGRIIRVLVEPQDGDPEAAVATAARVADTLSRHGISVPQVHHGYDLATWEVIRVALRSGWDIRVGLEDTRVLPDGSTAAGNADLVAAAVALAREAGRR